MTTTQNNMLFIEQEVLHELKHYLPAQAPLKDFIHHNTLHAFQEMEFFEAIHSAKRFFGYRTTLSPNEYYSLYRENKIKESVLDQVILKRWGSEEAEIWKHKLTHIPDAEIKPEIGNLRALWKRKFHIDLDSMVQPTLFRIVCSYLDQGIAMWQFPVHHKGFLTSLRELDTISFSGIFKGERARQFLRNEKTELAELLDLLVGNPSLYRRYLFDQQFAHQGWSGIVSVVEDHPETLLDPKQITLREFVFFELLLEIDALDSQFNEIWKPLSFYWEHNDKPFLSYTPPDETAQLLSVWQEAYEWTYYQEVLFGLSTTAMDKNTAVPVSFQALFCLDDRECSLRRHIEHTDPNAETFGTPGFFGVEFYYQPEHGKFKTKLCPAPVTPKYLIKEANSSTRHATDIHIAKHSHGLVGGWLITQTIGYWSALRLLVNIFKPSMSPATASSLKHMDALAKLTIMNSHTEDRENGLQIGFTVEEMAERVTNLLKSIGLVQNMAPLVYVIGHGSSSVNNPHYAAYDCGACSGRPGSVNARVFSFMANHRAVRSMLEHRGIHIPQQTTFVGGLHDTTRDEIVFYDEDELSDLQKAMHEKNKAVFEKALDHNAKERSRRFEVINSKKSAGTIHKQIKTRSVSLFEPRPELNHATNTLCIVGPRELTKNLFLDRRAFLNSYNSRIDPDGTYLLQILKAAAPVCGGINLEYFFSRVDNQRMGAGTKLPHNVMGLIGVANGIDGDLRTGLPAQMIEVHDPIRLLMIVEHKPEVILKIMHKSPDTMQWFTRNWIHLIAIHPDDKTFNLYEEGVFRPFKELENEMINLDDPYDFIASISDNAPVIHINR
ncbi:MAG: DUF2309 domain-containing protein [Bacteroidia bacterium]|jgi:hypothetical protein